MPFKIQRTPRGLNDLLSVFGGQTPTELEDRVRASVETTQLYGMSQRRVHRINPGGVAAGGGASLIPGPINWVALFGIAGFVQKTGTVTALRLTTAGRYNQDPNQEFVFNSADMGPYGATQVGMSTLPFRCPYPLILPPNTSFLVRLDILGTDPTQVVELQVDCAVLG